MIKRLFRGRGGKEADEEPFAAASPGPTVLTTPNLGNGDDDDDRDDLAQRLFTRENTRTLAAFFMFIFSSGAFMSIITPFLPLELARCGADSALVGLVFSAYPLSNLLAVPVSTRLCSALGRPRAFILGASIEALFGIAFGYAHALVPAAALKWLYLCIRFVQGLGSSIAYTALIGWVSETFRDRLATLLGFQEAVGGIGLILGPSLGGLLYGLGGVPLPLVTFSVIVLVSLPPLFLAMSSVRVEPDLMAGDADSTSSDPEISVSDLVNVSTANSTSVTLIAAIGFGFVAPVAAPHFQQVLSPKITPAEVGLLLAIPALLYAVLSPASGMLSETWFGYKGTMASGITCLLLGFLLFGPLRLFGLEPYTKGMWLDQVVSLVLLGSGAAFAFVPALPDMQLSVRHLGPDATNAIAGFFNGMYCLGEATGPLVAGLKDFISFDRVCLMISFVHAAYLAVAAYWCVSAWLCRSAIRKAKGHKDAGGEEDRSGARAPLL